jgi:hypothetical protein
MTQRSKFYTISFPAFGLLDVPVDYKITTSTIEIQKKDFGKWYIIDRFDKDKTLLERYLAAKEEEESIFDVTCLNLSQLISKRIKWVIDAKARTHNLSTKQTFKARNVKVIKVVNNAIWLDTVSYPFIVSKRILDTREILSQYATIVYIDNVWILHKFTSFHEPVQMLKI